MIFNLFAGDLVEDSRLYFLNHICLPLTFALQARRQVVAPLRSTNMATGKPAETNGVDTSLEELLQIKVFPAARLMPSHAKSWKFMHPLSQNEKPFRTEVLSKKRCLAVVIDHESGNSEESTILRLNFGDVV